MPSVRKIAHHILTSLLAPLSRTRVLGTLTSVATQDPLVALTFDDGPDPDHTPRLLDLLERYDVKATFFMVGERVARYPDLVDDVAERGHVVANHTWSHESLHSTSLRGSIEQLLRCKRALSPRGASLMRPPWGQQRLKSRLFALLCGYQVVLWTAHAQDWVEDDPERIAEALTQAISPGSIFLLHDSIYKSINESPMLDRTVMLQGLETFLKQSGQQCQFVTLPTLLKRGNPVYERHGW